MKITFPICVSMALLSFGLTRYYTTQLEKNISVPSEAESLEASSRHHSIGNEKNIKDKFSKIIFASIYLILIAACAFSIPRLDVVYVSWNLLDMVNIFQLVAAIMLCFLMPGYAIVTILAKNYKISPILKLLLAYLLSLLITASTIYFSSIYFDSNAYENRFVLVLVHFAIFAVFVVHNRIYRLIPFSEFGVYNLFHQFYSNISNKLQTVLKENHPEVIVFASLSALIIISTYYVYDGITVGDQWYHQNRAIFFMYGNFKDFIMASGDQNYTPLLSSLIAGLTSISGVPLVNSYASLAILNMTAVFGFYFLCRTWLPSNKKRASLFAASLFVIAAGFGWIYVLYLEQSNPVESQTNSISYFVDEKIRESDIRLSANFMIAAFPDFSTGLTLVTLPAGFALLSLIYVKFRNMIGYITIISAVSFVGIIVHDEFYIFVVLSSLLPLAYNLKNKSYVYFALFIALTCVYLLNGVFPVKYFTANRILGTPVLELNFIFTLVTFSLYLLRQYSYKYLPFVSIPSSQIAKKFKTYISKSFIPKVLLVAGIAYICILCFLVWSQIPANYLDAHTQNYNTPWYLYPMRLGVVGIIGIASILSYLFKRFEREVFVFGIIIIISLLASPYYNEHRLNKYVMVGMIGFASVLIFKLLNLVTYKKQVLSGVIIASIIVTVSLSTLMYIGYNALVIQTQDYTHALGRRNFPSSDEMKVLDLIRPKIQDASNPYNIASFANEYNYREGDIISKLHAFSGLPLRNSIQTQYILNASTVDSFYHLLELSGTRYIMIPTNTTNQMTLTDPVRFAINNFQQVYKDQNYVVLSIPWLSGPSMNSQNTVGIMYERDNSGSLSISDTRALAYDNHTYNIEKDTMKFLQIHKENQTEKATLYGYKKNGGKTLWSKDLDSQGTNYIELRLRTVEESKSGKGISGLKWNDGNRTYFVSLSDKGLQLREQMSSDDKALVLSQNSQVKNDIGMWHLFKVEILNNTINVYLDNTLKINAPRNADTDNSRPVLNLGIFSENSVVEFEPIIIGRMELSREKYNIRDYNYYYPLTSLALSGIKYSSYADNDHSIFSNEVIILPFESKYLSDESFHDLLEYTRLGGTLVVINSDGKLEGKFSNLFSIEQVANETKTFARISGDKKDAPILNVSGKVKHIKIQPTADLNIIASYRNGNNQAISPFAIEKRTFDSGRIIYVNGFGYFDAIINNPKKYFLSLTNFSNLIELESNRSINKKIESEPVKRFIGDVIMSGNISINSSSFSISNSLPGNSLPGNNMPGSHNLYVKNITIMDKYGNLRNYFENLSINSIKVFGKYNQLINLTDKITLPSSYTHHDYVGLSTSNEFDMTTILLDKNNTYISITTNNSNSSINTININNESKINFYGVKSESPVSRFVPILVKSPQIVVNGNVMFDKTNFYGQEIDDYVPLNVTGLINVKFGYIDDYKEPYRSGTKINYLTYLDSLTIDGKRGQVKKGFELPGHISSDIERRGLGVPLISILSSSINFIVISMIATATIFSIWLFRKKYSYQRVDLS